MDETKQLSAQLDRLLHRRGDLMTAREDFEASIKQADTELVEVVAAIGATRRRIMQIQVERPQAQVAPGAVSGVVGGPVLVQTADAVDANHAAAAEAARKLPAANGAEKKA